MFDPVEIPRIDDHAPDCSAVAANVLGQRMHHNVSAEFEWLAQIRRGNSTVDNERHPMLMGNAGQPFDIDNISRRVADRFAKNGTRLIVDTASNSLIVIVRNHARFDALTRKRVSEQIVGAAIKLAGADDILTSTRLMHWMA